MGNRQSAKRQSAPKPTPTRRGRRRWGQLVALVVIVVGGVLGGSFLREELRIRSLEADVEAALARNQPREAFNLAQAFLKEHPNDHQALALQARALVLAQRPDEAHRIFAQIGAASGKDTHAWARACLLREDWHHALPLLLRAAEVFPDSPEVLHELTVCRMRLGQFQRALESANTLEQLPGSQASGTLLRATIHSDLKNYDASAEAFDQLLEISPQLKDLPVPAGDILTQHGGVLVAVGRADEALAVLNRVTDSEATSATWHSRGLAHLHLSNDEDAVRCWHEAIKLEPADSQPREALADAELRRSDAQAARAVLAPVLTSDQLASSTAYLAQRISLRLGDHEQARHWQETAARLRKREQVQSSVDSLLLEAPDSFWAHAVRARKFALEGNWQQAEATLSVIVSKKSDKEAAQHPFIAALIAAIDGRTEPPPLDELPLTLH